MGNLLAFIRRYFHVLLFVTLQVLAMVMLYHSMNYPRFALARATQVVTTPINEFCYKWVRHFNFSLENEGLVKQNLELMRSQEANFLVSSDSLSTAYQEQVDTLRNQIRRVRLYDYSYANVVYNTIHHHYNYLMIDKGSEDGVVTDMAVISSQGVVGVVTDVTPHFAKVTSLLHPNSKISAKVLPSNQLGTVSWEFGDPTSAFLEDIPEHMDIHVGDSVFTSGYSDIFPSNILLGVITEKSKSASSSFLTLKLHLATDFNHINTVYLVRNLYKDEMETLKSKMENE
ncbi:MAG: rod shape-determining protein MreC [Bacteroidales bacterium]|nr:rod shape-determining protein MreC [Bacteroidales bacterium]